MYDVITGYTVQNIGLESGRRHQQSRFASVALMFAACSPSCMLYVGGKIQSDRMNGAAFLDCDTSRAASPASPDGGGLREESTAWLSCSQDKRSTVPTTTQAERMSRPSLRPGRCAAG